ncbi:potassium channel family protein [Dactylosporangium sp. NPDC000244]|uniref:potassium channel family protein n=1 Tax=Dactylosporangium sp. NPDC000244 TaxID=3154365 RepID=UPI00332422BB
MAVLRSAFVAAVLVAAYFVAPLRQQWSATTALAFVGGLLLVVLVAGWQVRAVVRSPHPRLRALEALVLTLSLLFVLFAASYFVLAQGRPTSFSQPLTRVDAFYFTTTVFATVGFGDIAARSQPARIVVTLQMFADLIYVTVLVRLLIKAAGTETTQSEGGTEPELPPRC